MILRTMRLPEEIQRSSPAAHHELGTTPDGAHAVELPVVHLGLDIWLLVPERSKLCMVPSPLAAIRWCSSIFKNEETYSSNLLKVITLVSPSLLSHILTNPSSSPVTEMLMSKLAQLYKGESWHFRYLCLRERVKKKL